MKMSTKGRYGLRAMVDLAVNASTDPISLNSIAERQNVSENYLEQVFSTLRKAGLVKSAKGAQGGYALGDLPSNITVGSVLRALEGNLTIIDQEAGAKDAQGDNVEACIAINVWSKIDESINQVVDAFTLEDLAEKYLQMNENHATMYYI